MCNNILMVKLNAMEKLNHEQFLFCDTNQKLCLDRDFFKMNYIYELVNPNNLITVQQLHGLSIYRKYALLLLRNVVTCVIYVCPFCYKISF